MKKLTGKVAIITGASSGMGLETAKLFLQEGAKVVLTGRTQDKLDAIVSELTGEYLLIPSEAASVTDSKVLIEKTVEAFGKIDILFLNAGILRMETIEDLTEELFDEVHNVNVRGPLFTVREATPHLNEGASIIFNTSIVNGKGFPAMTAYGSSKAALRSITRTLASEFGSKGIRVNSLSPGPIETPLYTKHNVPQENVNAMAESFPEMVALRRFGQTNEVATVALFLASADSSYITGAEIPIDGGLSQI